MKRLNIYKKSLAMALIRKGHDLEKTKTNNRNPKYQVFIFVENEMIRKDLCELTGSEYIAMESELELLQAQ